MEIRPNSCSGLFLTQKPKIKRTLSSFELSLQQSTSILISKDMTTSFTGLSPLPGMSEIIQKFYSIIFRKREQSTDKGRRWTLSSRHCAMIPAAVVHLRCSVAHFKVMLESFPAMSIFPIDPNPKIYYLKPPSIHDTVSCWVQNMSCFKILKLASK